MNGCTFKRTLPSGRITWGYSIDAGKDASGKRKQIFKSGFEKKSEAAAAMRVLLSEKDNGDLVAPDPQTFAAFVNLWFQDYGPRRCSLKTLERYRSLGAYVTQHLGSTRLQDLSALALERVFNQLKDSGGFNRYTKTSRPLSAMTIHHVGAVVSVILKKAVKLKLLKSNPMEGVELPAVPRTEARVLDPDKMNVFLNAARAHYGLYEVLTFAAATGCRRGEALALTWADVDLVHGAVCIAKSVEQTKAGLRIKTTKTERARTISLPASLLTLLRFQRERQEENRRLFGADYRADLNLVFCYPHGDYMKPNLVSSKACFIARRVGLPKGVSMHTLRHSHASQLLSAGVSLPTVSKRLGHTDPSVTARIYSHPMPKDDVKAAELWDANFQNATPMNPTAKVS